MPMPCSKRIGPRPWGSCSSGADGIRCERYNCVDRSNVTSSRQRRVVQTTAQEARPREAERFMTGRLLLHFPWVVFFVIILLVVRMPALAVARGWNDGSMVYLDNGIIRLGLDLSQGGAITYLSRSGSDAITAGPRVKNMINSYDRGREVQLSFYSGPYMFHPPGTTFSRNWIGLGWNPIQCGDTYGHSSRVTQYHNDGETIHLQCVPKIWPLENYEAECIFDIVYRLNKSAVEMDSTLIMSRPDVKQYSAPSPGAAGSLHQWSLV